LTLKQTALKYVKCHQDLVDGLSSGNIPQPAIGKEAIMGEIVHQSYITITREKGPTRIAHIRGFDQPVYYGVHGGIKAFYNVDPEEEHAATLDHLVGAVGG
jgi:hypothetical protein